MKKALLLILLPSLVSLSAFTQAFINSSLDGPPGPVTVATDWTMISPSPDLITVPFALGFGITFTAGGADDSPDGGTFQLIWQNGAGWYTEEFGQTVSGFTIGETYTVTYYEANFGPCYVGACYEGTGEIIVTVSDVGDFTSGNVLEVSDDWLIGCISFTATSETHTIGFQAHYLSGDPDDGSWIAIDNPVLSLDFGGVDEFYYPDSSICTGASPSSPVIVGDTTGNFSAFPAGLTIDPESGEIDPGTSDAGVYTVFYSFGCADTQTTTVEVLEGIDVNFEFSTICAGSDMEFTNTSIFSDEISPEWEWDFGDGGTSTETNPNYLYDDPGTYTVELVGTVEGGCNDTIEIEITVDPVPVADFEFVIGGFSSEDGATGGCIASAVQFNDLSTIADPGIITSWSWDFGDGSTSDEENPEHTYGAPGTYTVTLTVETENGCSSTYELDIIMTESLTLDIISNDPTCFGFSDGSITVNVTGGTGDLVFEIKNDLGDLMNEDNSNTANTLPTGTYTITVSDDTECSGEATVFLDQPDEINADLTVVDPLCYGDASGWARVDSVYNATGLYDQISFFWAPNPPNHEGLGADSLWDLTAGEYTLTINDENGCSKVFDFVVDQPDSLHFVEFGFEHAHCRMFGYQSGNGVVFGAAAGGTPDYTYLWENLDNGDTEITSTWGGLNPGNYRLTATDENGCIISREVFLDSLSPEAAFTVISDQLNTDCQGTAPVEVEFENNSINFYNENDPFGDSTFFWNLNSPNGDWQLTHDYFYRPDTIYQEKNQTYEMEVCLVALNKNGCSDTACKIITIYKPIAFEDINIFTPNGDGNNDVFTFEFRAASISEFHCVIVNRWGVVVEELNDIAEGWDGTDKNGDPCKDGVYFYVYEAITDNNNTLTGQGNIQLVSGN